MSRLEDTIVLFDLYNSTDPNKIQVDAREVPAELFYAQQLYRWVNILASSPSEFLLLASRAQHIGRWTIARSAYAEGKAGYYQWRTALAAFHAKKAGEFMESKGYTSEEIAQVQEIIQKKNLKTNPEVQCIEDALCLVFLQFQFEEFVQKHSEEKIIEILRKTWAKMSEHGHQHALQLSYSAPALKLIKKALGE